MHLLLAWLFIPMVAITPFVAIDRLPGTAGRLLLGSVGLAALWQGAGTLDPVDLRAIASHSANDSWFICLTAGVLLSGGSLRFDWHAKIPTLSAIPFWAATMFMGLGHIVPLIVGCAIGAIPLVVSIFVRPIAYHMAAEHERNLVPQVILTLVIGGTSLFAPTIVPFLFTIALAWWSVGLRQHDTRTFARRAAAATATVLILVWLWATITIDGSAARSFMGLSEAPISLVASQGLVLIAFAWGILLAGPWPFDRIAGSAVLLPVAIAMLHLATVHAAAEGLAHWQPVWSVATLLLAICAAWAERWAGAAAALALLSATRGSAAGFTGAELCALLPWVASSRLPARGKALFAVVGVTVVTIVLMADQVLLAVLLAFLAAIVAHRSTTVARPSTRAHL